MSNEIEILNGKFIASKNEKGEWIYKASDKMLKKDGKTLTKKYHDLPRYPIIIEYEDEAKNNYDKYVRNQTLEIVKKLRAIIDE